MKTKFVVGYVFDKEENVILIRKNRPSWQKGLLNGVGGHVEQDESSLDAMRRECFEEGGVYIHEWRNICYMGGSDWELEVYATEIDNLNFRTTTDEKIEIHNVNKIWLEETVPNVKWLIPMCLEHMKNKFTYKKASFEYE